MLWSWGYVSSLLGNKKTEAEIFMGSIYSDIEISRSLFKNTIFFLIPIIKRNTILFTLAYDNNNFFLIKIIILKNRDRKAGNIPKKATNLARLNSFR
ncbi:hypothetical protein BpHYR1_039951 [Brachionus plicatilis]|uniref:Uncharacterized protein n=1 Tax=Brachionus plicatilis TaxID=10195 RepID=A0A3M7PBT6_BRAPC|nr:hypothetical protein BpHYR1_039951 [Brachionus plicatilis]